VFGKPSYVQLGCCDWRDVSGKTQKADERQNILGIRLSDYQVQIMRIWGSRLHFDQKGGFTTSKKRLKGIGAKKKSRRHRSPCQADAINQAKKKQRTKKGRTLEYSNDLRRPDHGRKFRHIRTHPRKLKKNESKVLSGEKAFSSCAYRAQDPIENVSGRKGKKKCRAKSRVKKT